MARIWPILVDWSVLMACILRLKKGQLNHATIFSHGWWFHPEKCYSIGVPFPLSKKNTQSSKPPSRCIIELPHGNLTKLLKMAIYSELSTEKWWLPIVMLAYQGLIQLAFLSDWWFRPPWKIWKSIGKIIYSQLNGKTKSVFQTTNQIPSGKLT